MFIILFFILVAIELCIMGYGIFNSIRNLNKVEKDKYERLLRAQEKDIPDLSMTGQFVKK